MNVEEARAQRAFLELCIAHHRREIMRLEALLIKLPTDRPAEGEETNDGA